MNRDDVVFTDKMATENPKRFFAEHFFFPGPPYRRASTPSRLRKSNALQHFQCTQTAHSLPFAFLLTKFLNPKVNW